MPEFPDESVAEVKQRLLDGMVSFMQGDAEEPDFDCGYTQEDIDRCGAIVAGYLAAIASIAPSSEGDIRLAVKKVVLELNELNDNCGGGLIETDQREDLCQIILMAAKGCGLKTSDDITEEWREW